MLCDSDYTLPQITLSNLEIDTLVIEMEWLNLKNLLFDVCYFNRLVISTPNIELLPQFRRCEVARVESHFNRDKLAPWLVEINSDVEFHVTFKNFEEFRKISVDDRMIAAASILDKLF